jgi:hypothetical protein
MKMFALAVAVFGSLAFISMTRTPTPKEAVVVKMGCAIASESFPVTCAIWRVTGRLVISRAN